MQNSGDLERYITQVLLSALDLGNENSLTGSYSIDVHLINDNEGYFDFVPNFPISFALNADLNKKIMDIVVGACYPMLTFYGSNGPEFVSTDSDNINTARALRFWFKVGTYSRIAGSLSNAYVQDGKLKLMNGFEYDSNVNSGHIAISGASGSGKTQFALYLLSAFYNSGAKISIVDPKLDDSLYHWANNRDDVDYHYPEIGANSNAFDNEALEVLSNAFNEIGKRQSAVLSGDETDFEPYIIFVDEAAAYSSKKIQDIINKIVLMGRSCKVWIWISAQSMDAKTVISSTARDSMGLRVVLSSNPSANDCRYLFKDFDPSSIVIKRDEFPFGLGLIEQQSDGRIVPFLAPKIEK